MVASVFIRSTLYELIKCYPVPELIGKNDVSLIYPFSLQTGMRGAYGKPQGTVARVNIGQIIMSVRARDQHQAPVIEALRRAKMKFPGRQKIAVSRNWGFTKWPRSDFQEMMKKGSLVSDGVCAKYLPEHGPLVRWKRTMAQLAGVAV
ncbi:large subunit ribosomal protein L10e [Paragonimus westermani]|uniref:Large subunit ribosomal protein L10e n=1 Tax=Paragonimus westermani TaxID=34504 RepID=A0A5J4ND34_9TREM|nr:large subunit ribosomal protein L10e [Paragonimus westermani]